LLDKKVLPHKLFTSKDAVPLTGGFLLFISLFFFNNNAIFIAFSLFIFTLGVFADLNIVKNSTIKFIIQSIVVFFFLYFLDLNILITNVFFIDYFIKNKIFSLLFTTFCLLILINGTASFDVKSLCGNTFLSSKKLYFVEKKLSVVRNAMDKPIVNKDFINNILY